ncbi:extracellular solute-binding protein [Solwaraspora sp. WMMD791]|uniref:extracellular solute-binding protein n=1 Tax=Solwaraspora sp. WMMD791 TaxID=3016086 RepID=UPI00249B6994|nr:extracellular solute-binding protein [Solwaraspora sp. WMMD791]WFE24827.1 extracellular solute-binding protein [Solwaraspora sp. WMMD791]
MPEQYSRRSFFSGVLATGTFTAATFYLMPGGRRPPSVELTLATGADPTGARDLLISIWNRNNPQTVVRVETIAVGSGDERQIMLEKARQGSADLLNLDIIDVPEFADQKLIVALPLGDNGPLLPSLRGIHRVGTDDSHYWAVPFNTDVGMLFARTDGDAEPSGPPPSLPELLDAVPDGSQQFIGQLRPSVSAYYEAFVVNVLEHAAAQRPGVLKPVDDSTAGAAAERVSEDLDLWRSALTPLREAIGTGRVLTSGDEADSRDRFAAPGSPARYMRNWPVKYRELQQLGNPDVRTGRVRVDQLTVGVLGGQSLAVVARSPYADRARAFIDFVTSDDAQKILAMHGLAPTSIAAYNDPNLRAAVPHLGAIRAAVEQALPRPAHRNYRRFSDVVKEHVEQFLYQGTDLGPRFIDEMLTALD